MDEYNKYVDNMKRLKEYCQRNGYLDKLKVKTSQNEFKAVLEGIYDRGIQFLMSDN